VNALANRWFLTVGDVCSVPAFTGTPSAHDGDAVCDCDPDIIRKTGPSGCKLGDKVKMPDRSASVIFSDPMIRVPTFPILEQAPHRINPRSPPEISMFTS
jgi:hypothetical protein